MDPRTEATRDFHEGDYKRAVVAALLQIGDQLERLADLFEATTRDNGGGEELRTLHMAVHS